MNKFLHIVCLDAPSPPDYGGAIDMFYKIKSLAESGLKITLHYFNYHENRDVTGLEQYCFKIIAYKRMMGIEGMSMTKPYIVSSRVNQKLIDNLNKDDFPILLEGFHCTGILPFIQRQNRKIIVRVHNDEAIYYNTLALCERNWLKKAYYKFEGQLLKSYQRTLPNNCIYAFISESDNDSITCRYQLQNTSVIPSFVPWQRVEPLAGVGNYGLYQGNLSVAENIKATNWLIQNVFSLVDFPFIIAGKNATKQLMHTVKRYPNVSLVNSPLSQQMDELIRNAQVHILPSFNQTGVKLKLLNVLFNGRFCITNKRGVQGSGLEKACYISESADEFINKINALKQTPFTEQETVLRHRLLQLYDNEANATNFLKLLNYTDIV